MLRSWRKKLSKRRIDAGGFLYGLAGCCFVLLAGLLGGPAWAQAPWSTSGADLQNTRAALSPVGPNQLSATTVKGLKVKWSFVTAGDVSATPTVEPGGLYVPDWGGMLYKLDPTTGAVIWSHRISDYTGDPNSVSRSSPAIVGNAIIIGDLSVARVIAIDKNSGALLWVNFVDDNPDALASTSPTVYDNIVYFGISSREEIPHHPPSGGFRGKVVALDAQTGALLWRFFTVPVGYTGGAVVAPPIVDPYRNSLYLASNNNYSIPPDVETCVQRAANPGGQLACMDPSNYVDAIVSIDLKTGKARWARRFSGADTWTGVCLGPTGCPQPPGNDFDFASAPNLFAVTGFAGVPDDRGGTSNTWVVGAGQKNGVYWTVNPNNGGVFWGTRVGLGGIQWGSAIDLDTNANIYVAIKNQTHSLNTITDYQGNQMAWNAGSWARLDARTGAILWQIPAYGQDFLLPSFGASAPGPLSFSNHVVFAGASSGWMTALDSTTGYILWKFQSGGSVWSSPAIFNDWVYWGTGYGQLGGKGYNRLYAFSFQ